MDFKDFTADGIRAQLQRKREAQRAEERAERDAAAAQQKELREAFEQLQLPPDAMQRVMRLVERAIKDGLKEALVYQFPSDFMNDNGRSITSSVGGDWPKQLTGGAKRAYEFFKSDLEPRGFLLGARIVDYKDGIPGDVGLFLTWVKPEG